jgi:RNA polymerase primary sigma factor
MDALSRRGEYLGAREREMVIMRFGLANEPPYTLQAIATEFNLTRERVRQIVDSALTKMGVDPW